MLLAYVHSRWHTGTGTDDQITERASRSTKSLDQNVRASEIVSIHRRSDGGFYSTLFYVGGIFCAGLLVDSTDPQLTENGGTVNSSPFVIAFKNAGMGSVRTMRATSPF